MDLDPTLLTWAFVVGGVALMLIETVVPGGIAFFLGVGGVVVGGLRALGLLLDPMTAVVTWIFLSTGLTIALRPLMLRFAQGDTSLAMTDEDAEAMGETVTVVDAVGPDDTGRIRFRGATWEARTLEGTLPEGAEAQLLYRDNLTWIVEPADHADLDAELSEAIGSDLSAGDADRTRSADDRSADDRSADDRSADDRSADDRSADDRSADDRNADDRSSDDSGLGYDPSARQAG